MAKSNETVLQVAILTGVHTRAGAEEDVFSRGCNLRDLVFSIWLPPRALLPVLNTAIILPHPEETEEETEFCPGYKDVDAFVKVGGSFQWVNFVVSIVVNVNCERIAAWRE